MARKPVASPRAPEITPAEAKNARPSDIEASKVDDLYEEAKLWLDGKFVITTEAEAEGVDKMLAMARKAWREVDDARDAEKRPFDTQAKEVQERYKPILTKATRIQDSCKAMLTKWRLKLADDQRRAAEETERAAAEARRIADAAAVNAKGDIGASEIAETAAEDAKRLTKTAAKLDRDVGKGLGLRTVYDTEIVDQKAALYYYLRKSPQRFRDLLQQLAEDDVRHGARQIDGFSITERKEAF